MPDVLHAMDDQRLIHSRQMDQPLHAEHVDAIESGKKAEPFVEYFCRKRLVDRHTNRTDAIIVPVHIVSMVMMMITCMVVVTVVVVMMMVVMIVGIGLFMKPFEDLRTFQLRIEACTSKQVHQAF